MTDPREENLPKWAQMLISGLRQESQSRNEYLTKEVAKLRPQVELLTNRLSAMDEIMQYLIRGGHPDAEKIRSIVGGYGMKIVPEEGEP